MSRFIAGFAVCFAVLAFSKGLQAAEISYDMTSPEISNLPNTWPVGPGGVLIPPSGYGWTDQKMSFPKFDASLGKLVGVRLDFGGIVEGSWNYSRGLSLPFTWRITNSFGIRGIDNDLIDKSFDIYTHEYTLTKDSPDNPFYPWKDESWSGPADGVLFSDKPVLDLFSGTGNIDLLTSDTLKNYEFQIDWGLGGSTSCYATMHGKITYVFEPVPEPGDLLILLGMLPGFAIFKFIQRGRAPSPAPQ